MYVVYFYVNEAINQPITFLSAVENRHKKKYEIDGFFLASFTENADYLFNFHCCYSSPVLPFM